MEPQDSITPRVYVIEDDTTVILSAEMPGVGKDGISITVNQDNLVITGRRAEAVEGGEFLHHERNLGDFYREFALGESIDTEKVKGEMKNGVLTLTLPKKEAMQPRKVDIA